jgi:peroxiredoxin
MLRVFVVVAALFASLGSAHAGQAKDFSLRNMDRQEVSLSDLKGKVVIISFWATWCAPCKEEMVHLEKMYRKYKDQGLEVLAISIDDARLASKVKPYIKSKGYTFEVLYDTQSKVVVEYNPSKSVPYTTVIGRDFEIAKVHTGYTPGDEKVLEEEVLELLGAKPDAAAE